MPKQFKTRNILKYGRSCYCSIVAWVHGVPLDGIDGKDGIDGIDADCRGQEACIGPSATCPAPAAGGEQHM